MSPSEDDLEEVENEIDILKSDIEDLNDEIKVINDDIDELKFSKEDYEIYLFPTTIKRYIKNLIIIQQKKSELFFPSSEIKIGEYFKKNFSIFDYLKIKYNSTDDFTVICQIISDQGRSGSSFIENIDNVIDLNKPLLLFYGMEQISAYYSNLHFNFTWENTEFKLIRYKFTNHGIDAFQFKNELDLTDPIEDLLNKKIKLKKAGQPQRFFLAIAPRFLPYFNDELEISLIDLLKLFFCSLRYHIKLEKYLKIFMDQKMIYLRILLSFIFITKIL